MYVIPEMSDPLRGIIVWGTTGLLSWLALAAMAGMGLRWLGRPMRRTPPARRQETDERFHEAA